MRFGVTFHNYQPGTGGGCFPLGNRGRRSQRLQRMYLDHRLLDRLITDGPHRWVRHRCYLGFIIGALARVVAERHVAILLIAIVMVAITVITAFREERVWLASPRVPRADEYREYRRRTAMFLPFDQSWLRCATV